MKKAFRAVTQFITVGLWHDHAEAHTAKRIGLRALQVAFLVGKRFREDKGFLRASALAYTTLLSLVPLLAFAFAMLKGLGADKQLRDYLYTQSAVQAPAAAGATAATTQPAGETARTQPLPAPEGPGSGSLIYRITGGRREPAERLFEYIDKTNATALGAFGLVVLLWTVVKVLGTVEVTFNEIWGIKKGRAWLRKFADYTSVMVIAPVLLVTAIAISGYLLQSSAAHVGVTGAAIKVVLRVAAWFSLPVLIWASFTALYALMPNTNVRFLSALTGGIVGGTLWQLAFWVYTTFNIGVANYNAVYTSFAALPIFLVWIYFSWVIVIIGAEASYAHTHIDTYRQSLARFQPSVDSRELLSLRIFLEIASVFRTSAPAPTDDDLAKSANVRLRGARDVLEVLKDAGLVAEMQRGGVPAYKPARDLVTIAPRDVLLAVRRSGDPVKPDGRDPIWVETEKLHAVLTASLSQDGLDKSVAQILDRMG